MWAQLWQEELLLCCFPGPVSPGGGLCPWLMGPGRRLCCLGGGEEGESGLSLQEDGDGTAKGWLAGLETTSLCLLLKSHLE